MYDMFTERARRAIVHAGDEARRFGHDYIGTEHILLGLVKEGTGAVAHVLRQNSVSLEDVRDRIVNVVRTGPPLGSDKQLAFTPRAKEMLERAMAESRALKASYVGTEHLLLALLHDKSALAGNLLMDMGLQLEAVRRQVLEFLGAMGGTSNGTEGSG